MGTLSRFRVIQSRHQSHRSVMYKDEYDRANEGVVNNAYEVQHHSIDQIQAGVTFPPEFNTGNILGSKISDPTIHASIVVNTTMKTFGSQTDLVFTPNKTDVLISFQAYRDTITSSSELKLSLYMNSVLIADSARICNKVDRFDDTMIKINWLLSGLIPGKQTTINVGGQVSSGTCNLRYGGGANRYPALIVQAISLP